MANTDVLPIETHERSNQIKDIGECFTFDIFHCLSQALANRNNLQVPLEDHVERKQLEEYFTSYWYAECVLLQVQIRCGH